MSTPIAMESMPSSSLSVGALTKPPDGYPQVASFMGEFPEMAMVRRFRGLNARNLLYLQAELVQIEKELLACERADAKDEDEAKKMYSKDFAWLQQSEFQPENKQWKLIDKMRKKLKEYNDILIQQTTLARVSNPSKYDTKQMQQWFERDDLADMPLEGDDASIWASPGRIQDGDGVSKYVPDLIAINGRSDDIDRATSWLAEKVIPNWHNKVKSRFHKKEIVKYRQSALYDTTAILATTLSSLLPVLSIVVLYLVHSMPARLGIIAGFTAGFSIALSLITSAERVDNFAATAAFAAVQVVFVGTNGNSTSGG